MDNIPEGFTLICNRCGAKFTTFYYDGGGISHKNNTDDWNLKASYNKGDLKKEMEELNSVDLRCVKIWMKQNNIVLNEKIGE